MLPRGGEAPGGPGGRLLWSTPRKCCHRHSRLTVPTRPAFLLLLGTHLSPTMTPFSSCPRLRPCRWHLSWVGFPGSRAWHLIYQGRAARETETGVGQQAWAGSRTAVGAVRPPPPHTPPPHTHTPPHTHSRGAHGAQSRGTRGTVAGGVCGRGTCGDMPKAMGGAGPASPQPLRGRGSPRRRSCACSFTPRSPPCSLRPLQR